MLARRLRRRANIDPTLVRCIVFAGTWRYQQIEYIGLSVVSTADIRRLVRAEVSSG